MTPSIITFDDILDPDTLAVLRRALRYPVPGIRPIDRYGLEKAPVSASPHGAMLFLARALAECVRPWIDGWSTAEVWAHVLPTEGIDQANPLPLHLDDMESDEHDSVRKGALPMMAAVFHLGPDRLKGGALEIRMEPDRGEDPPAPDDLWARIDFKGNRAIGFDPRLAHRIAPMKPDDQRVSIAANFWKETFR